MPYLKLGKRSIMFVMLKLRDLGIQVTIQKKREKHILW